MDELFPGDTGGCKELSGTLPRKSPDFIYRGPTGTTIDAPAMEAALSSQHMILSLHRDTMAGKIRVGHREWRQAVDSGDDPCRAEIRKAGLLVDDESFPARERIEGMARLLRRVLPEPAKVLAHMSDEQWTDFQGSKADAA